MCQHYVVRIPHFTQFSQIGHVYIDGSKGDTPMAQNFLNFMQFFRNIGHNRMLVSPAGGLAPTHTEIRVYVTYVHI